MKDVIDTIHEHFDRERNKHHAEAVAAVVTLLRKLHAIGNKLTHETPVDERAAFTDACEIIGTGGMMRLDKVADYLERRLGDASRRVGL